LQDFITGLHDNIASSFLPREQDVTEDYWEWLKWRLGQVGTCADLAHQQGSDSGAAAAGTVGLRRHSNGGSSSACVLVATPP
jgi:hypothetical protein